MSTTLIRIKRLLLAGQYQFSLKAESEMRADNLEPHDIVEAVTSAVDISKVLKSRSARRSSAKERLYVIFGSTYDGISIYTKGTIRDMEGLEIYYFFISSKRDD